MNHITHAYLFVSCI